VFSHKFDLDCPQVTEWPDHPWDKEKRISEDHGAARFKRNNPEMARGMERLADKVEKCDHEDHHKMLQEWQGVMVVCKVCNNCGKTRNLFQDL
jgi:hypothetical protein